MGTNLFNGRTGRLFHRTVRPQQQGQVRNAAERGRRRPAGRSSAVTRGECLPKKIASLGFGKRATLAQKTLVVQALRQRHALKILLSIAQMPCATFYYHLKQMQKVDKYASVKDEITAIHLDYSRVNGSICRNFNPWNTSSRS